MDKKTIRYETEIKILDSSIKVLNPQFSLCDVLVCYHGDNRNYTSLPKKIIEENLYSIYGVPIIGEWIYKLDGTDEKTWGSHGGRIILDDNGIHFEQTTKPFGFVTKEAADTATWITITEKDGHTQHEYLKLSGCILWTERYEESKTILDDNYGQSMEIEIPKGHYRDDNYFEAEKITFSALCILGTNVEPCFESACIGRHYNLDSFKMEYSLMLDEYKRINDENKNKEVNCKMNFEKIKDLISAYSYGENESPKYSLIGKTTEHDFTIIDMEDGFKIYKVEYTVDNEEIVADWESKVEMDFSLIEKTSDVSDVNKAVELIADKMYEIRAENLTADLNSKIDEMAQEYSNVTNELNAANEKIKSFESKEAKIKMDNHKSEVEGIIKDYSAKLGRLPKFLIYKAKLNPETISIDALTKDLTLMAGEAMMNGKKEFSYTPNEVNAPKKKSYSDSNTNRYGNLLDKYRNM